MVTQNLTEEGRGGHVSFPWPSHCNRKPPWSSGRPQVHNQGVGGATLSKVLREGSSLASSGSCWLSASLGVPRLVSTWLPRLPPSSRAIFHVFSLCPNCPLLRKTPVAGLGLTLILSDPVLTRVHLQRCYFPTRSCSQVPDLDELGGGGDATETKTRTNYRAIQSLIQSLIAVTAPHSSSVILTAQLVKIQRLFPLRKKQSLKA